MLEEKKFLMPKVEIIEFGNDDIILASGEQIGEDIPVEDL